MTLSAFAAPHRSASLLLLAAAAACAIGGCRDSETVQRERASAEIDDAGEAFVKAARAHRSVPGEGAPDTVRELDAIASRLNSVSGASGDQQASAALLSASVSGLAGDLSLEHARVIERAQIVARDVIGPAADSAGLLWSLADAQSKVSLAAERQALQNQKAAAETALRAAQTQIKEIEAPIATLNQRLAERRDQLTRLLQSAEELRRRANEAGARAGFPFVEEAASVRSNARAVQSAVALDEIQLGELEPELSLANAMARASQSVAASADSAMTELENFANTLEQDAAATRKQAEALRKGAEDLLATLVAERDGPLLAAYESAQSSYERLSASASRAGGGGREMQQLARQLQLEAQSQLGAVYAARASSAELSAILLERLASAGELFGGAAKAKAALDELHSKRDEFVAKARESYSQALATLGSMSAESPTVARTKKSVEDSLALLGGPGAPLPALDGAAPAGTGSEHPSNGSDDDGTSSDTSAAAPAEDSAEPSSDSPA